MLYKKFLFPLLIVFISLIPLADLFRSGLPLTHDGQDHVARIANFYQNLSEGNIIPRWAANLNWGYGHPILQFLYPLPSYLASFFHFFGFTLVDSVKLVFGISFILSGLGMYLFIKELLNDGRAAFLASTLYIIAPYRFVDLYVRGAIGEHVAFIFPPLIFYFLLKLSKRYSFGYIVGGALSLAGLNLAHNAISLMFIPLFGLYALFLLLNSKHKPELLFQYSIIITLGFGLSAFFWLPAFMEGKYTLRDIVTRGGEYATSFVAWKAFFAPLWSYGGTATLSKQIGIIHWAAIFGSISAVYYLYKKSHKVWIIYLGCLFIFWTTLFLMTSVSNPIWQTVTILQKFQFPWRFLSITVFLSAFFGGVFLSLIKNQYKTLILFLFIIGLLAVNKDYWHPQGFLHKPESFYTGIYNSTTDTGESAPIWSVRFMEKRPRAHAEVILGKAEIKETYRSTTKHEYIVTTKNRSRIRENTLYFPGWEVLVDGKKTNIEFQDQANRGLITYYLDKGKHDVVVKFRETKLRIFANVISIVSFVIMVGLFIKLLFVKRV